MLELGVQELKASSQRKAESDYVTVIDSNRKFVEVSDSNHTDTHTVFSS
jgi:hypothetical protein